MADRRIESLDQILQYVFDFSNRRLRVDASGTTIDANIDEVGIAAPDDFRSRTYTVTAAAQQITFGAFQTKGLIIKAINTNPGFIRIGKSDVATTGTDFYLQSPGESLNVPLEATTTGIYFSLHPGEPVGTYQITVFAVNA